MLKLIGKLFALFNVNLGEDIMVTVEMITCCINLVGIE
jgi:hypothetical protein